MFLEMLFLFVLIVQLSLQPLLTLDIVVLAHLRQNGDLPKEGAFSGFAFQKRMSVTSSYLSTFIPALLQKRNQINGFSTIAARPTTNTVTRKQILNTKKAKRSSSLSYCRWLELPQLRVVFSKFLSFQNQLLAFRVEDSNRD